MADVVKLGIGLETAQAQNNAKQLTNQLDNVAKGAKHVDTSSQSMTASMIKAQVAFEAVKAGAKFLADQFMSAVQTGAQFEQQMANVKAVSGATEQQFKDLEAAALKMGKTTAFSASESASALEAMSKAGFSTSESIAALDEVLQLSAASGMALGESANLITNIMSSMNVEVEDLTHVNNVLVKTFTSTNTTLQGLGQTFSYAGGIAATTGVSIEQLAAAAGILGNAGIDASRAGTALRAAMTRLIDPSKEAAKVLQGLNVEAGQNLIVTLEQLEKQGATTQDMIKIFGQEAGGALAALKQAGGIEAVKELVNELENVGDVAEKLSKDQLNTLNGDLKLLNSAIENVRIVVFKENNEALRSAIQAVTEVVNNSENSLIKMGEVVSDLIKYFVGMSSATKNSGEALDEILPIFKAVASAAAIVGFNIRQIANGFLGTYNLVKKLNDGEFIGGFKELAKWTMKGVEDFKSLGNAIDNIWTESVKINKEANEEAKKNAEIQKKAKDILEQQKDAIKNVKIEARDNIKVHEEAAEKILKHKEAIEDYNNASENFTQKLHEDTLRRQADAQIEAYVQEQILKPAYEIGIHIFGDYADAEKDKKIAVDNASISINNQANQLDRITQATKKATEETIKYADANARALGTGSVLGSMGGLVGSTFSVPSGGFSSVSSTTAQSPTAVTSAISTNTTQSTLKNQLAQFQQLQQQILDYVGSQQSLDIQLADAESQLRNISVELADLNENELTKRLALSNEYFDTAKKIDTLQESINKAELSHVTTLDGILDTIQSDYRELTTGDFAQLIPVDKFKLLKEEFTQIATAVDSIDFSEITSADKQLIEQFRSVSMEYLAQAEDVFASSDNYQVIKDNVKSEFDNLAANISGAMNSAAFAVNTLGRNSQAATTNVNGLATKTGDLGTSAGSAETNINSLESSTQKAGFGADALNATIGGSSTYFTNITNNLSTLLTNTDTAINAITTKFAAMGEAIVTGSTVSTTGTTPALVAPETVTEQFTEFGVRDMMGLTQLYALTNLGQTKILKSSAGASDIWSSGVVAGYFDTSLQKQIDYSITGGNLYKNGTLQSLNRGAWRINGNNVGASLHDGEMVIRSDDAPAVRSMMRQSGMSQSYGISPSQNQSSSMPGVEQILYALDSIKNLLETLPVPKVYLDSRLVSNQLNIYDKLSSLA